MQDKEFKDLVIKSLGQIMEKLNEHDERFEAIDERFNQIDKQLMSIAEQVAANTEAEIIVKDNVRRLETDMRLVKRQITS